MHPADPPSLEIQKCLDRLDGSPPARDELICRSQERVRILVRRLLGGFSRLRRWEDSDDVLQAALPKLHASLADVRPPTVRDYYRLAAARVRRVLLDLTRHHFGPEGAAGKHESPRAASWPAPGWSRAKARASHFRSRIGGSMTSRRANGHLPTVMTRFHTDRQRRRFRITVPIDAPPATGLASHCEIPHPTRRVGPDHGCWRGRCRPANAPTSCAQTRWPYRRNYPAAF